jgi:hypothetical protein
VVSPARWYSSRLSSNGSARRRGRVGRSGHVRGRAGPRQGPAGCPGRATARHSRRGGHAGRQHRPAAMPSCPRPGAPGRGPCPVAEETDQIRPGCQQMLDVVEDERHRPRPKIRIQGGCGGLVGRLETNGPCDRRDDEIGIADRGQRDERHRVEPGVEPGRHLDRKPGLAHPARPRQRHQPCRTAKQQVTQRDRFLLTSNDRGQRHRPVTDPLRLRRCRLGRADPPAFRAIGIGCSGHVNRLSTQLRPAHDVGHPGPRG